MMADILKRAVLKQKYHYLEQRLYMDLVSRKELEGKVVITLGEFGGIVVDFVKQILTWNGRVVSLSIIYPVDGNGFGRLEDTIETALCVEKEGLVYKDSLGYDDVGRFGSADEVVQEIWRLCVIADVAFNATNSTDRVQKYASKELREIARKKRKTIYRILRQARD